jgi:hypothetical protein
MVRNRIATVLRCDFGFAKSKVGERLPIKTANPLE